MKLLFITATNTNVGKTYVTKRLIELFAKQGISVGVFKPIETGVINKALDATELLETVQKYNSNFHKLTPLDITAYTFKLPAAPFCADLQKSIQIENIKKKIKTFEPLCDLLLIEGAGGLMVPITSTYKMIDLIDDLKVQTLLVTPSKLGCINDTLLSIEALTKRKIDFDWCVNIFEDKESFHEVTAPFYDEAFPEWWNIKENLKNYSRKQ